LFSDYVLLNNSAEALVEAQQLAQTIDESSQKTLLLIQIAQLYAKLELSNQTVEILSLALSSAKSVENSQKALMVAQTIDFHPNKARVFLEIAKQCLAGKHRKDPYLYILKSQKRISILLLRLPSPNY